MPKFSYDSPDATARQFKDITRQLKELNTPIQQGNTAARYVVRDEWYAESAYNWSISTSYATPGGKSAITAFDKLYDVDLTVTAPGSGVIAIEVESWISAYVYITSSGAIDLMLRLGVIPTAWVDGAAMPNLPDGSLGGSELSATGWGTRTGCGTGSTVHSRTLVKGLTPNANIHVRTRRYFWIVAHDSSGNNVPVPSTCKVTGAIQKTRVQVVPIYHGSAD